MSAPINAEALQAAEFEIQEAEKTFALTERDLQDANRYYDEAFAELEKAKKAMNDARFAYCDAAATVEAAHKEYYSLL
jgi:hypothetical protein